MSSLDQCALAVASASSLPARGGCQALVSAVLEALATCGVSDICLCPGARNALFVQSLHSDQRFRVHTWPEERSAAFYALGLIKGRGLPAAVITSSGTAAGELLPAIMEAYYSALPLLAVTADRPRRFRGTGAPQCAEQAGLFGPYAAPALDIAAGDACPLPLVWSMQAPAHLNVCLEDPRGSDVTYAPSPTWQHVPKTAAQQQLTTFLAESCYPLVLVGALPQEQRAAVTAFLRALGAPVYLEAPSGLREEPSLAHLRLCCVEGLWQRASAHNYPIDAVLRLGGVPTLRPWRDLDASTSHCQLLSIDAIPFPGATRGDFIHAPAGSFLAASPTPTLRPPPAALYAADQRRWHKRQQLFGALPTAETSLMYALSRLIPAEDLVYLGNSLPIREWDLAASHLHPHAHIAVNRGLNGIDGQLTTFLGMCQPHRPAWGIFGDLTTLYDLVAPWILQANSALRPIFIIVNNGGGQIFARLFEEKLFLNSHSLSFAPLAQMWHLQYEQWKSIPTAVSAAWGARPTLIEVIPDALATARFWEEDSHDSF